MKRYSTFVCNYYLPLFVSFYNSYKYYNNEIPMHVYNYKRLNTFNIQYLKKYVDVSHIDVQQYGSHDIYFGGYAFKYLALINHMVDHEIILDVDANFLNKLDFLFEDLEANKIILSREGEQWHDVSFEPYYESSNKEEEALKIRTYLSKHIGSSADVIHTNYNFPNYNAGLLGFSKSVHTDLLLKSLSILFDREYPNMFPLTMEQPILSLLVNIFHEIDRTVLPQKYWMNTWEYHKEPKKSICVKDKKLRLEHENGNQINFYHYTGDIGAIDVRGNMMSGRLYYLTEEYFNLFTKNQEVKSDNVKDIWFNRHENPVLFLYEYFRSNGPAVAPKVYSVKFRDQIVQLLKTFYNEDSSNEDSRVFMICLLYDYVNLLNYKLIGSHPYYKILDLFINKEANDSINTIGIDVTDATVNLSLSKQENIIYDDWFFSINPIDIKEVVFEKLGNLYITTKTKQLNL